MNYRRILLLLIAGLILAIGVACADISISEFLSSAFPRWSDDSLDNSVQVNIYIQSSEDMVELLGTQYNMAVDNLMCTALSRWHRYLKEQQLYRFDVLWLEDMRQSREFAYPLDPYWWSSEGVRIQSEQILEPTFYSLSWYEDQLRRSPNTYADRNAGNPSPWSAEEQRRLSRTIEEVATHRNGEREISIIVTNFVGHHLEDAAVRTQILEYLLDNDRQSIAVFAFENSGTPFCFLIFGSTKEVVGFSEQLVTQLRDISLEFGFDFITNSNTVISGVSRNKNVKLYVDPAQRVQTVQGVREAFFREDLSANEQNLFNTYIGEDRLLYTIYQNLIDGSIAPISLSIGLDIPHLLTNKIKAIKGDTTLNIMGQTSLSPAIPHGATVVLMDDGLLDDGSVDLLVNVDTSIFEGKEERALIIVQLYAELEISVESSSSHMHNNQLFTSTFNQLSRSVTANTGTSMHPITELYIHIIYRR